MTNFGSRRRPFSYRYYQPYPWLQVDNLEVWFESVDRRYVLWYITSSINEFSRPIPETVRLKNWMVLAA